MFADHGAAIRDGLNKIRSTGADVVLIDPQFAPKVIVKAEAEHMVELIATTAKMENVDLFSRFNVMKRENRSTFSIFAVVAINSTMCSASAFTMTFGANCGSISTTSAPVERILLRPSRIAAPWSVNI